MIVYFRLGKKLLDRECLEDHLEHPLQVLVQVISMVLLVHLSRDSSLLRLVQTDYMNNYNKDFIQ